jgi:UDP-N-acetylglucosamine--N-acetylmuramyl-(pentapeptide) pyrophosphoryl-undecaprenol N-acetylglucosamine transferase
MAKLAVVAAGGTGGHLFPAQALAEALIARGWRIALASDQRVAAFAGDFPAERKIGLSARTFRSGDPVGMARAGLAIIGGVMQARRAFAELDPAVVVGFGGYPSVPGLVAAISQGRPTVIHEQNAVMGRANRRLAPRVRTVACAFPVLQKAPASVASRAVVVGNPVRPEIRALAGLAYEPPAAGGPIRVLMTGGSQGARLLSERLPQAAALLPAELKTRLRIQQQTRPENLEAAKHAYAEAGIEAEVAPFFKDMAARLSQAHLVVGRSGAGTVCELAVAGRPSILIPLAIALDDDQGQNARLLSEAGAAEVVRENVLTAEGLSASLARLLGDPGQLSRMAAAARGVGKPDAAERLADVVEQTAQTR